MEEEEYFKQAKQKVLEELSKGVPRRVAKEKELSGEELKRALEEKVEEEEREDRMTYKITSYEREDRSSFGFHLKGQIAHSMAIGGAILTAGSILGHETLAGIYSFLLLHLGLPPYDAVALGRGLAYATPVITAAITIQGIKDARKWWNTYLAPERLAQRGLKLIEEDKKEKEKHGKG